MQIRSNNFFLPSKAVSNEKDLDKYLKEHPEFVVSASDSIQHMKCGSIDVHKKILVAAVCITDPTTLEARYTVQKFKSNNADIETMVQWFEKNEVKDVIILRSNQKYPYTLVELIHMDIYVVKIRFLNIYI